jgi:hypothetical protein
MTIFINNLLYLFRVYAMPGDMFDIVLVPFRL